MARNDGIPVIGPVLNKIIGTRNERFVRRYTSRVEQIGAREQEMLELTDAQIRERVGELKERIKKGEKGGADAIMVEAFALGREAMDRSVGIRNIFDPGRNFDPKVLPENVRPLYDRTRQEMEALPPIVPETYQGQAPEGAVPDEAGAYLGSAQLIPGWRQVDIPIEIYTAVRELYPESKPPYRARPFDVQLIGAMVLFNGKIAEMKTGEGKTIVAPLATLLAAIEGLKVHVVTVNDYLVQRDRDWVYPFFRSLGLTVGAIHPQHMQSEDIKRKMYRCDVVYGTTSEFGFDYLRDNMKPSPVRQVQRRREFAIVDEVDSILIDEARTPLIISGPAHEEKPRYEIADDLARHLVQKHRPWHEADEKVQECIKRIKGYEGDIRNARDKSLVPDIQKKLNEAKAQLPALEEARDQHTQYYEVHPERKQAHLTHEGIAEAQRKAGVGSFYVDENMDLPHLLEQSLRAHVVYERDRDYIIMPTPDPATGRTEPSVVIVDTFTGRPMIGRQWSDGLHQAVEAKEKVPVKQETQTVATVTIQNFYKMYERLAGMTGTADTEAQEFHDIYHLDVVSIPTNKEVIRADFDDLMFLQEKDKWDTIVDEIKTFHDVGRPMLVGTTSVEKSERLSQMLNRKHQIHHEVLNAKQHEREAHIVENAGQLGAVMIATNMAGRGTDIKLGKVTREQLLEHWLKRSIASAALTVEATDEEVRQNVFRKVAPQYLKDEGVKKRDAEAMPFEELELKLLRNWALNHTWMSPRRVETASAEELMEELDKGGRFLLHRIRWFGDIEDLGGLHVIGTERHESRRIDNQLRGRSGRQGDKGSSRFFVSLQDDLMKMFAGETTMKVLSRLGMKEGDAIEHPMLSKSVERAQRKVEERNFQARKNILEYDEVMEHQRQQFYGVRQRVLEGRDVKGLMIEYIDDSIEEACDEYLDKDYPAQCAAEFAKEKLDCSILAERLRGKDAGDMERTIRREALEDARQMIDVTLGEYMPIEGSEVSVDFDSAGLVNWARSRFGVELHAAELREGGAAERRHVMDMLVDAARKKIEATDLSGLSEFTRNLYGAGRLAEWVQRKFGITIDPADIGAAVTDDDADPADLIKERTRGVYETLEIEYPVTFALETTMSLVRQSPQQAMAQLATWANRRYQLGWTEEQVKSRPPQKIREELEAASRELVESGRLEKEIEEAAAIGDDVALAAHIEERFGVRPGLPDWMIGLRGERRAEAIRGRIESILRAELLQLEQTILVQTLDDTWKDHLYTMDQLRDAIGFRAFSQQDPRIEYKREGAARFKEMMHTVRDRVTDFIFKVRLTPQAQGGVSGGLGPAVGGPRRQPAAAAGGAGALGPNGPGGLPGRRPPIQPSSPGARPAGGAGGMFTGPGFD